MEPKLIRKDIKYQKKTLIVVSLLVISLFVGGSFALLSSSDETEEVVTFKTGNFNLEAKTTGTLSLDGEVPKSYDDGFKNNDITLTLTNTGSLEIGKYDVKLEGDTGTTLDASYIRYSVSDDEGKTYLASKLLSETNNIIYTGYSLKTTKVLKVKLWIDEAAGENALKKSYNGKINVELYQNDDTLVDVVKSKLVSNYSGSNESFEGGVVAVNNDGNLYHETNSETIREYRYSGPTVNNYVTFNDEVWRIVGVFKDENNEENVKIVRNNALLISDFPVNYTINGIKYTIGDTTTTDRAFWNYVTGTNSDKNDWTTAGLQYWLNTYQDEEGTNGYLSKLSNTSVQMIADKKYYLGNAPFVALAKVIYNDERKDIVCSSNIIERSDLNNCYIWYGNKSTWTGKVGLLYPSDWAYSANTTYWNTEKLSGFSNGAKNTTWMFETLTFKSAALLFISPSQTYNYYVVNVRGNDGNAGAYFVNKKDTGVSLPSLYLKSNVKITSGTGEQSNPYKLILE